MQIGERRRFQWERTLSLYVKHDDNDGDDDDDDDNIKISILNAM